ncbi:MAG TPA: methyltransferase domain-containing protein [Candidatus Bathyarchaeia archaeon]|nr:methyltransferase domain-containing protein [Candidatus Bathyarchaeia archaeon]
MPENDHFNRLNSYFTKSRRGYDIFLWGAKHFGYYPIGVRVSEKQAQSLMQDLIGEKVHLQRSDRVLDAGCGQGVVTVYLAERYGCRIEGITVLEFETEEAINLARKHDVSDLVDFSLMDYADMTFSDASFDAVYTMESLSHAVDVKKALSELFRVLKNKGKIALFEYTIADDNAFSESEMEVLDRIINLSAMDGLKQFRHDKFSFVMKDVGFQDVKIENITENVEPSLRRLRNYAFIPYYFAKLVGKEKNHPNRTAAVEFYEMGKKDLFRYNIITAEK